jgi:hypothetical protein
VISTVLSIFKQFATAIPANMSLSVAASPKEQIYTITESRWNEINLQVQTLTSEVLTLSDAFACSMLCCIFLGLTCTTLIITRFNLLGSIRPVALFFGLFVSICLFSYRITLLLFLMFMVWIRWEDLNDWKRTMVTILNRTHAKLP